MNEEWRLKELEDLQILDTPFEKKLNDIIEIAAALCDAPISFISFLDKDKAWFKAIKGLEAVEIPRSDSFCYNLINNTERILEFNDLAQDDRFKHHPMVASNHGLSYYLGVPLKTSSGAVIGSLAVLDTKKREISEEKKQALHLLAAEVIDYLETRKLRLEQPQLGVESTEGLKNFSGQSSNIFMQIEILKSGNTVLTFLSEGVQYLNSSLSLEEFKKQPEAFLKMIYKDDYNDVLKTMVKALVNASPIDIEFRVQREDNTICWYHGVATTEVRADKRVIWYATFQDISNKKRYITALEQMSYDISHILRKPVTTLMSILSVIEIEKDLDEDSLKMYAGYLKTIGEELNGFTRILNKNYYTQWVGMQTKKKSDSSD